MFQIPRSLARQLRAVFSRALGKSRRQEAWAQFHVTADELVVQAASDDVAVEYRVAGNFDPADFVIPLDLLRGCEAKSGDPVLFERTGDNSVIAHWEHRGIRQQRSGGAPPKKLPEIPAPSTEFASNEPGFLRALADATETTDPESSRYALGCLALRGGDGHIVATDGRQALVQSGFAFPFTDELLVPALAAFGCLELPHDQPVRIGRAAKHVTLAIGPWTFHLRINEGRFPRVQDSIPAVDAAQSRLQLNAADGEFLVETIKHLPYDDAAHMPVTLDLNGQVIVRARWAQQPRPTDVLLTNSWLHGEPVRVSTDRQFLARAAKLGLNELCIYAPDRPLLAHDATRSYVWMGLDAKGVIPPAEDALRIESPIAADRPPTHRNRIKEQIVVQAVPTVAAATTPTVKTRKRPNPTVSKTPVEQAIALRDSLHSAARLANELAREFKHQKRQARIFKSTLASLKQLQKIGA